MKVETVVELINNIIDSYKKYTDKLREPMHVEETTGSIEDITNSYLSCKLNTYGFDRGSTNNIIDYLDDNKIYHEVNSGIVPFIYIKAYSHDTLKKMVNDICSLSLKYDLKMREIKKTDIIDPNDIINKYIEVSSRINNKLEFERFPYDLDYFDRKAADYEEQGKFFNRYYHLILNELINGLNIKSSECITRNKVFSSLSNYLLMNISENLKLSISHTYFYTYVKQAESVFLNFKLFDKRTNKIYVWDFVPQYNHLESVRNLHIFNY